MRSPLAGATAVVLLLFVLVPQPALAQMGSLCLFSDPDGNTCTFDDSTPGLMEFYVVHAFTSGATAAEFSAPIPSCMTGATYLADVAPFPVTIGTSQTGVGVGYGACLPGPIHVLTINVFGAGMTLPNCAYPVLPDPGYTSVRTVDCAQNLAEIPGGVAYINSSIACDCSGDPQPQPLLHVSPSSLTYAYNETQKPIQITNVQAGTLIWQVFRDVGWLLVDQESGSGDATVNVSVDRSGLPAGDYPGTVTVTSNGGTVDVSVVMTVLDTTPPVLNVNPTSLVFGQSGTFKTFDITNAGGGTLSWIISETIPWATVNPTSGTGAGQVGVTVDRSGVPPGTYTESIFVSSNGGNATVTATMTVPDPAPVLSFSPPSLTFEPTQDSLVLSIENLGNAPLHWTITPDETWLTVVPDAGMDDAAVSVNVNRTGLGDGTFFANLVINSDGGNGNVPVMLKVSTGPVLSVDPTNMVFSSGTLAQTFTIENIGIGTLDWSVSDDRAWIDITPPTSGSGNATVQVTVDPNQLPGGGQQTGHVNVTSNGGNAVIGIVYNPPPTSFPGYIGVFSEPSGVDCNIIDATQGLLPVYVVHINSPGATASQFSAPLPTCWAQGGAIYLSDSATFPVVIGNSQSGVAVAYGTCVASPIHVLTINYFVLGTGPNCCQYPVLPDVSSVSGQVEVVDCGNNLLFTTGLVSMVNPNPTCPCSAAHPTRETTWGQIKSLFAPPGD